MRSNQCCRLYYHQNWASYIHKFEVSESNCFCATVYANDPVGSAPSKLVVFWYKYEPPSVMTVTVTAVKTVTASFPQPTIQQSPPDDDDDDDDGAPVVVIILALVLVAVVIATIVLGVAFVKMYLLTCELK